MKAAKAFGWFAGLLLVAVTLAGCGKGGAASGAKAFDEAPPEMKGLWAQAVAADQADEYVAAVNGYRRVLAQRDRLTGEQVQAAEEAAGKLNQRLVNASLAGDAKARQALDVLGAMDRGQRLTR